MLHTNKDKLPVKSLVGQVAQLGTQSFSFMTMDPDGRGQYRVGTGGVTYNYRLGDSCMDLVGSHVEPGVSSEYGGPPKASAGPMGSPASFAYNQYACVGNLAVITGGPLDGKQGYVIGKISGYGVTLGFAPEVIDQMQGTEHFHIRAFGVGLQLTDAGDAVMVHNLDPWVLENMGIREQDGIYSVPVKLVVPGHLVGAGVGGSVIASCGQLMTDGGPLDKEYGLDKLCFGDYIAVTDLDMTSGRTFLEGAVSICQVVSSDCVSTGAGPGIMTVMASKTGRIRPVISDKANLANILNFYKENKPNDKNQ